MKHLGSGHCHRFGQSNNCCVYILHLYYRWKGLLFTPKEELLLQASACSPHPFPLSFSWMCTDALKLNSEEIKDLSRQVKRKSVSRQRFICRPTSGVSTFSRNNKRDTNNWKLNIWMKTTHETRFFSQMLKILKHLWMLLQRSSYWWISMFVLHIFGIQSHKTLFSN